MEHEASIEICRYRRIIPAFCSLKAALLGRGGSARMRPGFSPRAKAPANDRFNGLLSSLQSAFCNLCLAVPITSDSRSSGFPTPCYWLGTPWGLATY